MILRYDCCLWSVTFAVLVCWTGACAAKCGALAPVGKELASSTAVFTATVRSVDTEGSKLRARLRVMHVWKGVTTTEVEVYTSAGKSCPSGVNFRRGQQYLVYARGSAPYDLHVSECDRTTSLGGGGRDLRLLGTPMEIDLEENAYDVLTLVQILQTRKIIVVGMILILALVAGLALAAWRHRRAQGSSTVASLNP
jgi:hypothetical protein